MVMVIRVLLGIFGGTFLKGLSTTALNLLAGLGFGVATYIGFSAGLGFITDSIAQSFTGLPNVVLTFVNLLGIPQAMSIIASAMLIRAAFVGLAQQSRAGFGVGKPKRGKLQNINGSIDKAFGDTVFNTRKLNGG